VFSPPPTILPSQGDPTTCAGVNFGYDARMQTGLDRLLADDAVAKKVRGARLALLAHPASVTKDLVHAVDVLIGRGARPSVIFGPEHGYGGEAQDMIGVEDARDRYGIPVKSLYGATTEALSPREEDLADVDVVLIDLQDVGARYYTFVWTAVLAMRAATRAGKRVVVLDRPNPIGGAPSLIEGRMQSAGFCSFVGLEPIPIRHSLTLGELLAWRASVEGIANEQLEVVSVTGLDRPAHASAWDRPFIAPSPNMPTYATALVYPGACLLEGTNLSEGRGTTQPFEIFGAPWIDGAKLAYAFHALGQLDQAGVRLRPLTFRPTFHKHAGATCGGVQVHVTDAQVFRPVATYLALIALAHAQNTELFQFRTEKYEFVDTIPALDLLTGDSEARAMIAVGAAPADVALAIGGTGPYEAELVRAARAAGEAYAI
jgi:uncharacterized protein YbbC (DUF1343 family)